MSMGERTVCYVQRRLRIAVTAQGIRRPAEGPGDEA